MFSEGMYGLGGGIMNMRRPPNWRKRILPRVPFSSYEAAHSTSPVVEARTQHTPMAGKKGLSVDNMIKAMSEMKKPPDQRPAPAGVYGERRPQLPGPAPFTPVTGVNPSIMNTGGLPGARNKKWWEIMGYGR